MVGFTLVVLKKSLKKPRRMLKKKSFGLVKMLPGVSHVRVALDTGTLTVTSEPAVDDDAVRAAVDEAGYQLTDD